MQTSSMIYIVFAFAILAEVIGTSMLKQSEQFTKLWPSLATAFFYIVAFYLLSIAVSRIPIGIAYAIWSGMGIVLITVIGFFVFKERLDFVGILGIGLILAGVVLLNTLSQSVVH